ncbi:MAG: hypothetical protein ACR2H2_01255 [Solirubrobacteraceae bacterium]
MSRPTTTQRAIPLVASLTIDPQRLAAMWRMTAQERSAAAHRGELSLAAMCRWAARCPNEVELVDGEFFFLAVLQPDHTETRHAPA